MEHENAAKSSPNYNSIHVKIVSIGPIGSRSMSKLIEVAVQDAFRPLLSLGWVAHDGRKGVSGGVKVAKDRRIDLSKDCRLQGRVQAYLYPKSAPIPGRGATGGMDVQGDDSITSRTIVTIEKASFETTPQST